MARMGTSAATDYLHIDGLETVTLSNDAGDSVSVLNANKGYLSAPNQMTGMPADVDHWILAQAELAGAITTPAAGMIITQANGHKFVIVSASFMRLSAMWVCVVREGTG